MTNNGVPKGDVLNGKIKLNRIQRTVLNARRSFLCFQQPLIMNDRQAIISS